LSGSIGNVVGSSWKGIPVLKTKPLSVANPDTPAQQTQRGKFSHVQQAASALLVEIIQGFWNQYASGQSGYNLFVSRNIDAFDKNGLDDATAFNGTIGNITPAPITSVVASDPADTVDVDWTNNAGEGTAQATDLAIIIVYNDTQDTWYSDVTAVQRSAETHQVSGVVQTAGDEIQVWLSFQNAAGKSGLSDNDSATSA